MYSYFYIQNATADSQKKKKIHFYITVYFIVFLKFSQRRHFYRSQWTGWWLDVGNQCSDRRTGPYRGWSCWGGGKCLWAFVLWKCLTKYCSKHPLDLHINWKIHLYVFSGARRGSPWGKNVSIYSIRPVYLCLVLHAYLFCPVSFS